MTVGFSREPHTVHLRVGDEIRITESGGECGSPWSTKPLVIAAQTPPLADGCSGGTVEFKAISPGEAQIRGALRCRVPECTAAAAVIGVVVGRK